MTNITIPAADLRVLLDIAEGYTSENGLDSVGRYAIGLAPFFVPVVVLVLWVIEPLL